MNARIEAFRGIKGILAISNFYHSCCGNGHGIKVIFSLIVYFSWTIFPSEFSPSYVYFPAVFLLLAKTLKMLALFQSSLYFIIIIHNGSYSVYQEVTFVVLAPFEKRESILLLKN